MLSSFVGFWVKIENDVTPVVAALVQPIATAFDAGLRQPDAVRAKLVCGSGQASQIVTRLARGYGLQGQGHFSGVWPLPKFFAYA
jgi:threonine dehydrogenase-like Zn-dependent dehydrogenase